MTDKNLKTVFDCVHSPEVSLAKTRHGVTRKRKKQEEFNSVKLITKNLNIKCTY